MRSLGKPAIRFILEHALKFDEWTLQGLGMLRLNLSKTHRLHVWSTAHKVPGVTPIHTHPWDFVSSVISGAITNTIYREIEQPDRFKLETRPFGRQEIVCGLESHLVSEPKPVRLYRVSKVTYTSGQSYSEWYDEIHESDPLDGTVTLIERKVHDNPDNAFVYVPEGETWGDAAARPACGFEIEQIVGKALERWDAH